MQTLFELKDYLVSKLTVRCEQKQQELWAQYFIANTEHTIHPGMYLKIQQIPFQFKCSFCERKVNKLFASFCYPCFKQKPEADLCLVSPQKCHFLQGTCRDAQWGKDNCFQDHVIYLSFTNQLKVGLTRKRNVPFRWFDQGAVLGTVIAETASRFQAGQLEFSLAKSYADKTHWLRMLQAKNECDVTLFSKLVEEVKTKMFDDPEFVLQNKISFPDNLNFASRVEEKNSEIFRIHYPLLPTYPEKIKSVSLDKNPLIEGFIAGIKGQYIVFKDGSAFNMRRHEGYVVDLSALSVSLDTGLSHHITELNY